MGIMYTYKYLQWRLQSPGKGFATSSGGYLSLGLCDQRSSGGPRVASRTAGTTSEEDQKKKKKSWVRRTTLIFRKKFRA